MSIEFSAFLGERIQDLESRFIQAFDELGFCIQIHPDMRLLETNETGCLYLSVLKIPTTIKRIAPHKPLLVGFDYQSAAYINEAPHDDQWPPPKVTRYTYEVYTRTSSGRSLSVHYMQALTAAVLAKITRGYFYIHGESQAMPGSKGVQKIIDELNRLEDSNAQLQEIISTLYPPGAKGNQLPTSLALGRGGAFDLNGFPFETWPPSSKATFTWPEQIGASESPPQRLRWLDTSLYNIMLILFVTVLVAVSLIYS